MKIKTVEGDEFFFKKGMTILDAALLEGLNYEYSCKTGQCGICVTKLLHGEIKEKRPQLSLTESERVKNKILICCCEPKTDILIDVKNLIALKNIETKILPARIKNIRLLLEDVMEIILRFPPAVKFSFLEGQYLDVIGLDQLRRSYSIASTSNEAEVKLLIKNVKNGVMSEYWFNQAQKNDLLRIEGPKGTFFIRDKLADLVFLATGVGIAPVISMLRSLDQADNSDLKLSIRVFWGNSAPEQFIWQPCFVNINVEWVPVLSGEYSEWSGERGYVQEIATSQVELTERTHVYACGSDLMIKSAKESFIKKGLKDECFYSDAFVQSY